MNGYAMEINSSESRIKDKIDIMKRYDIDTREYEGKLQSIVDSIYDSEKELAKINNKAVATLKREGLYKDILDKMKELDIQLNGQDDYLNVFLKNAVLYNQVKNNNDYSKEKIDSLVEDCKKLINEMYGLGTNSVRVIREALNSVYKTIYEVIKMEIASKGTSDLLKFVEEKNDAGVLFLNDCVREDIKQIKKENNYDKEIEDLINQISKDGIDYNYANLELLLLIVLKDDKMITNLLNAKDSYYDKRIEELKVEMNKLVELQNEYNSEASACNIKKNRINRKAIICSIALSIGVTLAALSPKIAKSRNTNITYTYEREAYDTINNKEMSLISNSNSKEKEYTEVTRFGSVDEDGEREWVKYYLSDHEYDNIEEYVDHVNEYSNWKYGSGSKTVGYRLTEQLSSDEYVTVERMRLIDTNETFDEEGYKKDLNTMRMIIGALVAVLGVTTAILLLKYLRNELALKEAKKYIEECDEGKNLTKSKIKEYRDLKGELEDLREKDNPTTEEYKQLILKR